MKKIILCFLILVFLTSCTDQKSEIDSCIDLCHEANGHKRKCREISGFFCTGTFTDKEIGHCYNECGPEVKECAPKIIVEECNPTGIKRTFVFSINQSVETQIAIIRDDNCHMEIYANAQKIMGD